MGINGCKNDVKMCNNDVKMCNNDLFQPPFLLRPGMLLVSEAGVISRHMVLLQVLYCKSPRCGRNALMGLAGLAPERHRRAPRPPPPPPARPPLPPAPTCLQQCGDLKWRTCNQTMCLTVAPAQSNKQHSGALQHQGMNKSLLHILHHYYIIEFHYYTFLHHFTSINTH